MAGKKFFSSLFSSFLIVSLVPVVLLGYVAITVSSRSSMRGIRTQLSATCQGAASSVSSLFSQFGDNLTLFCEDPEVTTFLEGGNVDDQKVYRKMFLSLSGHADVCTMHLVSQNGFHRLSTGVFPLEYNPVNFGAWGLLRKLEDSSSAVVYPNRLGERNVLSIGQALKDEMGKINGYAIIDIPEACLKDMFSTVSTTLPISYGVYDEHGFVVYDSLGLGSAYPFLSSVWETISPPSDGEVDQEEVRGMKLMLSSFRIGNSGLHLVAGVPVDLVLESNQRMVVITLVFALCSIALSLFVSFSLARRVSTPITKMGEVMGKVERGDLSVRCPKGKDDELGDLSDRLNNMIQNLDDLFRENLEKQDLLRSAELRNLKAQIDPHFLYNTLDSIRYMIKLGMQKEAGTAISDLGVLLKNSISNSKDMSTVQEEMHVIDSYLEIVRLQHPDKIEIIEDVSEEMRNYPLPKLLIQPIVENAIVHGLEDKMGNGKLEIIGRMEGKDLSFIIKDNGLGIEEQRLRGILKATDDKAIGISNVQKRLHLYYGNAASMTITSHLQEGTEVRMVIPTEVGNVPRVGD